MASQSDSNLQNPEACDQESTKTCWQNKTNEILKHYKIGWLQ